MKDEIKEILDDFKIYEDRYKKCNEIQFIIFYRDIHLLLDYITNLQEKLNRIDKLINTDYGWVSYYYKYNNRYLKSEIKEDINNILKGEDK